MEESIRGDRNRFENLAPEIISDILSRLAIEWILSCKCVCRTWYALIKDNYFVKLQLSVANDRPSSRVIFEPLDFRIQPWDVNRLYLLDIEDGGKSREIPGFLLADVNPYEGVNIMCFLNGLICVASHKDLNPVVIYNPLIRGDYIILPKTEIGNVFIHSHHVTLGFDPSTNKYKAIRMLTYSFNPIRHNLCEVITIGEETSWRRVVSPYVGLIHHALRGGVFHQSSIYWIINKFINNDREYILEFDMTKEVFGVVSFPDSLKAPNYLQPDTSTTFYMQLQILGGSLVLIENDDPLLHIWRLVKQNGNHAVGYISIRIELPYKDVSIIPLLCQHGTTYFLLLQTLNGYLPVRRWKEHRRRRKELQFFSYYPFSSSSKKSDRFVKLWNLKIPLGFLPWCFTPSLLSAKAILLRNL